MQIRAPPLADGGDRLGVQDSRRACSRSNKEIVCGVLFDECERELPDRACVLARQRRTRWRRSVNIHAAGAPRRRSRRERPGTASPCAAAQPRRLARTSSTQQHPRLERRRTTSSSRPSSARSAIPTALAWMPTAVRAPFAFGDGQRPTAVGVDGVDAHATTAPPSKSRRRLGIQETTSAIIATKRSRTTVARARALPGCVQLLHPLPGHHRRSCDHRAGRGLRRPRLRSFCSSTDDVPR